MKNSRTTSYGVAKNFFRKWWFICAVALLGCDHREGRTNVFVSADGKDVFFVSAYGHEKAVFTDEQLTPGVSYRQDVCDRYEGFRSGKVEPRDLLQGMKLNVLMAAYEDGYFNYDEEDGINPDYPGLAAVLMDELAKRAGFTWRDSFGISVAPYGNHSWTDLLEWGVDAYDLNVDWWAQNVERMNMGVTFLEEWYDSSIILIRKKPTVVVSDEINFFNWVKPYDKEVWYLTIFTIILSGFVYQWLEYTANERKDRTLWEWTTDNLYKVFLGSTQEYQFEPLTFEAKLFGMSMTFWALLMTATYTANLASLLVSTVHPVRPISSISEAVIARTPICTLEGTNSDTYIELNMPTAIRVQKKTLGELYGGLRNGECDLAAEVVASWEELKSIREYNPTCELERVNAVVRPNMAGFAIKGDPGYLCTSIIGIVIDLHMSEMIQDGFLEDAWRREREFSQDFDCNAYRPDLVDADARQLLLLKTAENRGTNHDNEAIEIRRLKGSTRGATGGAVAASIDDGNADSLTLEQMIGTFLIHWLVMGVALVIGTLKFCCKKSVKQYGRQEAVAPPKITPGGATILQGDLDQRTVETFTQKNDEETSRTGLDASELDKLPERETCVHEQLRVLRNSQARMHADQSRLLEEQRMLKDQIGKLVSLWMQQQGSNNGDKGDNGKVNHC